jgi:para-aminobenzoate synthetase component 1
MAGSNARKALIREVTGELFSNKANELFEILADDEHSFFLDSGCDFGGLGRYSIIGSRPKKVLYSLKEVEDFLGAQTVAYDGPLPFVGGLVGLLEYDSKVEFGFFDTAAVCDNLQGRVWLVSCADARSLDALADRLKRRRLVCATDETHVKGSVVSNFTKDGYADAVERVKEYIKEGDVYQVNLSQRFEAGYEGSGWGLYKRLREINPAPFAAYLNFGDRKVLSSSPERFLLVQGDVIETRPIKGTRSRSANSDEDRRLQKELLMSDKDKAEHLMIVDLERNDLGKVCAYGSVEVSDFEILESYQTVHHLVSTVRGRLRFGTTAVDCIRACFPGGSITGAPKVRAMQIIDEIEPEGRGLYTGCIGYISLNGRMDLNIVIRTMIYSGGRIYFNVGGGIVADSEPHGEYQETLDKASALFQSLGVKGYNTMKACVNGEIVDENTAAIRPLDYGLLYGWGLFESMRAGNKGVFRLRSHLSRLRDAAGGIHIPLPWSDDEIRVMIDATLEANGLSEAYVRVTLTKGVGEPRLKFHDGYPTIVVVARKLPDRRTSARLAFSARYSVYSKDPRTRIKSTNYLLSALAKAEARELGVDDVIWVNENGFVTECSSANIFLVCGGRLITPARESGILPGITRDSVIDVARDMGIPIEERLVERSDVMNASEVFITNSINGITPIIQLDGRNIGDGQAGKITMRINGGYLELVRQHEK